MLEIGSDAPDFSVLDHEGNSHALADYRGRHLILWFYPVADTPG
jgi:thioredoxin-dependent peroxiredoxin